MSVCRCPLNYSPSKIDRSGLKCIPYTFTLKGIYTKSGVYLKGLTPSIAAGASQTGVVVATPSAGCCS